VDNTSEKMDDAQLQKFALHYEPRICINIGKPFRRWLWNRNKY